MVFGWRRKTRNGKKNKESNFGMKLAIPSHFLCPISLNLMKNPVILSSGITYDQESIETWLECGNFTCPVTNQGLTSFDLIPNHTLRQMIQDWGVENRNHGIERIPTPRVPVSSIQVSEALFNISASTKQLDRCGVLDLVQTIKKWGSESERNRRCVVSNGTSAVLATVFDAFASDSFQRNACLLEELLSAINWMFPLDVDSHKYLGSRDSLNCIIWLLQSGDLSVKQNAIVLLRELLSSGEQYVEALSTIEGVDGVLLRFIKEPICPTITKASLMVIFYLVSSPSSSETTKSAFVKLGLVSLSLEVLVDSERSISERALGVIDKLCDCEEGREEAYNNYLTMPVLVKKILRVSELASDYSVSTIWKLSNYEISRYHDERVLVEAVQVGAFQKLVLLLQLGCDDETKEKVIGLLKLMNPYRPGLECIESVDFKDLKRSF